MLAGMALECLEFQTGPEPASSIVVLHGLGADGNDFVPIAQELDLLTSAGTLMQCKPSATDSRNRWRRA